MELVVDAHHRAGFVVVDIRPAVPRVLGHSAQLGALAYSGRWISVKFSKSSPRAVTAVSSAMNSAVALQSSNRDLTVSTPEQARIRPDLSQLRLGSCLWIVLVLVRAFWVRRVGH